MENVGKKAQFLGQRPFLLSRICGVQNQFQGHFGLAMACAKADQCNRPLAACQRTAALPEDLVLWFLTFLQLSWGSLGPLVQHKDRSSGGLLPFSQPVGFWELLAWGRGWWAFKAQGEAGPSARVRSPPSHCDGSLDLCQYS